MRSIPTGVAAAVDRNIRGLTRVAGRRTQNPQDRQRVQKQQKQHTRYFASTRHND
jgi:hypothetical protein